MTPYISKEEREAILATSKPISVKVSKEWVESRPPFLPQGFDGYQRAFTHKKTKLLVLIDDSVKSDGRFWTHVSFSFPNRMPSYYEIKEVKRIFLGDRKALMVFPEEKYFVNQHSYCLHLWSCDEDPGLPEFSAVVDGERSI